MRVGMIGVAKTLAEAISETNDDYRMGFFSLPSDMQADIGSVENYRKIAIDFVNLQMYLMDFCDHSTANEFEFNMLRAHALDIVCSIHHIYLFKKAAAEIDKSKIALYNTKSMEDV